MHKCIIIHAWVMFMEKLRINPRAVCRNLLIALDDYQPLNPTDQEKIIRAIKSTGIETERVLASMSRVTLTEILKVI